MTSMSEAYIRARDLSRVYRSGVVRARVERRRSTVGARADRLRPQPLANRAYELRAALSAGARRAGGRAAQLARVRAGVVLDVEERVAGTRDQPGVGRADPLAAIRLLGAAVLNDLAGIVRDVAAVVCRPARVDR